MIPIFPSQELRRIGAQYRRVAELLNLPDDAFYTVRESASLWSPAQELHHIGLVNEAIFSRILLIHKDEDPSILRQGGPKLSGWALLTFAFIPRGKAKAPAHVDPPAEILRHEVAASITRSKKLLAQVGAVAAELPQRNGRFPHPFLGAFTAVQWLKFVRIHTAFHLQVTDLILKGR